MRPAESSNPLFGGLSVLPAGDADVRKMPAPLDYPETNCRVRAAHFLQRAPLVNAEVSEWTRFPRLSSVPRQRRGGKIGETVTRCPLRFESHAFQSVFMLVRAI